MTNLDSIFKSRDITLSTKVRLVKPMVFPVIMYGSESWTIEKAECWRIDAFELWCCEDSWETLGLQGDPTSPFWRSVLGVLWRSDAKAETLVLWPPHTKSWLTGKDSDAGSEWGQEEKGTIEDEMAGWHHLLDGHEFEWTLGVGDGQRGLTCCNSWGCKESDMTERLNWTELNWIL